MKLMLALVCGLILLNGVFSNPIPEEGGTPEEVAPTEAAPAEAETAPAAGGEGTGDGASDSAPKEGDGGTPVETVTETAPVPETGDKTLGGESGPAGPEGESGPPSPIGVDVPTESSGSASIEGYDDVKFKQYCMNEEGSIPPPKELKEQYSAARCFHYVREIYYTENLTRYCAMDKSKQPLGFDPNRCVKEGEEGQTTTIAPNTTDVPDTSKWSDNLKICTGIKPDTKFDVKKCEKETFKTKEEEAYYCSAANKGKMLKEFAKAQCPPATDGWKDDKKKCSGITPIKESEKFDTKVCEKITLTKDEQLYLCQERNKKLMKKELQSQCSGASLMSLAKIVLFIAIAILFV